MTTTMMQEALRAQAKAAYDKLTRSNCQCPACIEHRGSERLRANLTDAFAPYFEGAPRIVNPC